MKRHEYKIKSIYKRTPCKGHLIATEYPSQNDVFVFVNQQLYSQGNFFLDIIKNIYIEEDIFNKNIFIDEDKFDEKTRPDTKYSIECVIPNVKTYIEVTPVKPITSRNSYICEINKMHIDNKMLPDRFYTNKNVGKNLFSMEFIKNVNKYLHRIGADFLFFRTENIIIFPDIVSNPINKNDVNEFYKMKTDDEIYN